MTGIIVQKEMRRTKQRRQRTRPGGSKRVSRAEIASLEARLREREKILEARDSAIRELEENLSAKVHDLEGRLREKEGLLVSREAQLEKLKSKMGALVEEMTQIRTDKQRMSSETERLRSELKERKLLLAKVEAEEWRSIGRRNSWKRRLATLGKLLTKPGEEQETDLSQRFPLTSP